MNELFKILAYILAVTFTALPSFAFQREYIEKGQLSLEEEKLVIEFAELHGITDVAKIKTDYAYPTSERYIQVIETECIQGNVVAYRRLYIGYEAWIDEDQHSHFDEYSFRHEKLWARYVDSVHLNIIRVQDEEFRVRIQGWRAEKCEEVLKVLFQGGYSVEEEVDRDNLERVDFRSPSGFHRDREGNMVVTLGDMRDKLVTYFLTVKQNGAKISVIKLDMIII